MRAVLFVGIFALAAQARTAGAQSPVASPTCITVPVPPPPPPTKLEGFKAAAGSVITIGSDELGDIRGIAVTVRELREEAKQTTVVRGLIVEVTESQYRRERSFVDADEVPQLLHGLDMLLEARTKPTPFKHFEARYTTKGELQLTATTTGSQIRYAVDAGRDAKATRFLDASEMMKLRSIFAAAQARLASPSR